MRLPWIVGLSLVVLSAAGCRSTKPLRSWKGDEALYGWAHDTLAAGADPEAVDSIVLARSDQRYLPSRILRWVSGNALRRFGSCCGSAAKRSGRADPGRN